MDCYQEHRLPKRWLLWQLGVWLQLESNLRRSVVGDGIRRILLRFLRWQPRKRDFLCRLLRLELRWFLWVAQFHLRWRRIRQRNSGAKARPLLRRYAPTADELPLQLRRHRITYFCDGLKGLRGLRWQLRWRWLRWSLWNGDRSGWIRGRQLRLWLLGLWIFRDQNEDLNELRYFA